MRMIFNYFKNIFFFFFNVFLCVWKIKLGKWIIGFKFSEKRIFFLIFTFWIVRRVLLIGPTFLAVIFKFFTLKDSFFIYWVTKIFFFFFFLTFFTICKLFFIIERFRWKRYFFFKRKKENVVYFGRNCNTYIIYFAKTIFFNFDN